MLVPWHSGRRDARDEYRRIDVETARDLDDVVKAQIACPALDLADECPVNVRELCKGFLADAQSLPICADAFAKDPGGV